MNILIVDINAKLPALKYGGTQRVIWSLGQELVLLGHKVSYLVHKDSTCHFASIIGYDPARSLADQIPEDIDFIHFHHQITESVTKPYLITVHGNPRPDEILDKNSIFISKNHAKRHGSGHFVYNGLRWEDYPKPDLSLKRDSLHFLGKADWKIKNVFGAIHTGLKSGNTVHILGGTRWTFRNLKRGAKYLLNPKIVFHGMVENDKKIEVIQSSKGLLFPVLWHEPFGLAVIESLFAGSAVFTSANGSLPELVSKEVGVASNNASELAEAIRGFDYKPKFFHEYAITNFSSKVMTINYLKYYELILSGKNLHNQPPKHVANENIVPNFTK